MSARGGYVGLLFMAGLAQVWGSVECSRLASVGSSALCISNLLKTIHSASPEMFFSQQHFRYRESEQTCKHLRPSLRTGTESFLPHSISHETCFCGWRNGLSLVKDEQSVMARGMNAGEGKNWGHHYNLAQGVRRNKRINWELKKLLVLKTKFVWNCSTFSFPRWVICKTSKWISPVCEAEMPTVLHKLPECFTIPLEIPVRKVLLRKHMVAFFLAINKIYLSIWSVWGVKGENLKESCNI